MFQKAKREKVKVKIALIGPSGSGKTYSALRLATGIGGKIAVLDTEAGRSKYYADEFDFDIAELEAPFTPERYISIIQEAEKAGYDTLIIDSITHEWSGTGGCLDIHSKMPGNSYTNWAKVTPRHNKFIETILQSKMNIIATIRGKDQYVLEQDERGKNIPKKIGMGGIQREGVEYEYTCTFLLDVNSHVASVQKDNTHLFEGEYEVLTEEHGRRLKEWADSGIAAQEKYKKHDELQKLVGDNQDYKDIVINKMNDLRIKKYKDLPENIVNGLIKTIKQMEETAVTVDEKEFENMPGPGEQSA